MDIARGQTFGMLRSDNEVPAISAGIDRSSAHSSISSRPRLAQCDRVVATRSRQTIGANNESQETTDTLTLNKFTSSEALEDGVLDEVAPPEEMLDRALQLANKVKSKAKMGVYGLLRGELYGEALRAFQQISYVHSRLNSRQAKVKL
ncbi:hypothetical protein FPOAC2_10425 [Fusarium poae]|uniref:hypothetical protein n=1 Tax=Fusarium poae TaxID=36050 RepID=UPI001CEA2497|nr:hypothetical protein FPOAC1_010143 [Fusarium poae]KAG8665348.1 hypothetical protein FPOAC1_010143 [Fusarium poae]